jgi:hypothetical protein
LAWCRLVLVLVALPPLLAPAGACLCASAHGEKDEMPGTPDHDDHDAGCPAAGLQISAKVRPANAQVSPEPPAFCLAIRTTQITSVPTVEQFLHGPGPPLYLTLQTLLI